MTEFSKSSIATEGILPYSNVQRLVRVRAIVLRQKPF